MNVGHLLTAWTIRIALLCYVAVLGMLLSPEERGRTGLEAHPTNGGGWRRWQMARAIWTIGCLFFVGHVVAAFHFYHHWSHQAAFDDTAKQTKELMGWAFGQGIFVSYMFLVLWVSDAAAWWFAGERYWNRPAWLSVPLHAFLLFIAFNGTVVFKGGVIRAGGIVASLGLLALLGWRMRKLNAPASSPRNGNSFPETDARYE